MQLKPGTLLQGGKYKIVRFIKSGGFGCTYEAWNTMFEERVAIKEFFPKDFCNREDDTLHVTVGTHSKKPLVSKLRKKFIDEAKAIRKLPHPGIVTVSDVFEENGTAYYVMDYIDGCSLDDLVKREGALSEQAALGYIRQVCSALDYVHSQSRLHLDIKPGNIMIDRSGHAILIDFGTSKQYDEVNGENTSTLLGMTPGYAPLEQNKRGGVSKFTPATDIYSVGATLYKLLTGLTPPDADEVNENGLPPLPSSVSASTRVAVETAMSPKRKDRPQRVEAFLALLDAGGSGDETLPPPEPSRKSGNKRLMIAIAAVLVGFLTLFLLFRGGVIDFPFDKVGDVTDSLVVVSADSVIVDEPVPAPASTDDKPSRAAEVEAETISVPETDPLASQWENDLREYSSLMEMGDKYSKSDATLSQSKSKYEQALKFERKYSGTKYSDKFTEGASKSLKTIESRIKAKEEAEVAAAAAARAEAERLAKEQKAREEAERKQKEEEERKRNEASYSNGVLRVKGVEYPMVSVSGGSFGMGATSEPGSVVGSDEKPVHRVTLSSYSIGKYEVTQELWEAVMGSNPSEFNGSRRPVEQVSWNDCQEFIRKLNELTGANFRLPTEAEWEFAARGGNSSRGYKYSGSNTLDNVAWYEHNSGSKTHDVGTKSPNELGLYDMSGNVYEWCNDCYGSYSSSSQANPKGASSDSDRVYRGGGWNNATWNSRVSNRESDTPGYRSRSVGLRLCH